MRLLLCEDEVNLSNAMVTMFKYNKYEIDAVYDGQTALDYIKINNYDAVIMDIMMPKMDGISVLKEVRKEKINVPIIMLTAKSEIDDKVLGLDSGANDYLSKPFDFKELLARIRAITRVEALSSILSFEDLTLDRNTFELKTEAGCIRLANKEFQMLEMLINNSKSNITTERFMSSIWGNDSETEISVVWVYISYLRKKITSLSSKVKIKGKRNVGYFLDIA